MSKRQLWPHQKMAYRYVKKTRHPALFMQQRLGKTPVILRRIVKRTAYLRRTKPTRARVLIVAPLSVLLTWKRELLLEGVDHHEILVCAGTKGAKDHCIWHYKARGGFLLITRQSVLSHPELEDLKHRYMVVDESTCMKSPKALFSKAAVYRIGPMAHRRAILSGLPDPEDERNFFMQFCFLHERFMGCDSYWKWLHRYYRPSGYGWEPKKGTIQKVKDAARDLGFFLTRKQAGMKEKVVVQRFYTYMEKHQKKTYEHLEREFELKYFKPVKHEHRKVRWTSWATSKHVMLAKVAGGCYGPDGTVESDVKFRDLTKLLADDNLKGQSVVVWFRFNDEIRAARRALKKAGIESRSITGATGHRKRERIRLRFMDGRVRVVLMQIKVGQYGLDFSRADVAVYFSRTYSMEEYDQTKDRIVHFKKVGTLLLIHMLTYNTVDEDNLEVLDRKIKRRTKARNAALRFMRYRRLHTTKGRPDERPLPALQEAWKG